MIAVFTAAYSIFSVERQSPVVRHIWPRALVDLAILCVAGLIVGIVLRGGGLVDVLGIRVSFTRLYTPVLVFTVLVLLRAWMSIHPRIVRLIDPSKYAPAAVLAGVVCIAVLSPVLSAAGSPFSQRNWISPQILWRSSAPGLDLLAYLMPNPLHPLFGSLSFGWFASMTNGFNENVASIPWVAIATIAGAIVLAGFRPARGWMIFTLVFLFLSLGPFVWVAKQLTYIPTPWTLMRYLPILGAARMPTRMAILVMLGVSMILAMALVEIRKRSRRPWLATAIVGALLAFELLPAPRTLHSAELPAVYRPIVSDPRPVRVLSLPFGLKDGLGSRGNYSATSQFYQTFHEKRLVGGYISRLPADSVERVRGNPTLRVLLRMSEGTAVDPALLESGLQNAARTLRRLQIGYVVIDRARTKPELRQFAERAFALTPVMSEGSLDLYRTPIAPPLSR